jgi:hypothetical protein
LICTAGMRGGRPPGTFLGGSAAEGVHVQLSQLRWLLVTVCGCRWAAHGPLSLCGAACEEALGDYVWLYVAACHCI